VTTKADVAAASTYLMQFMRKREREGGVTQGRLVGIGT